MITLVLLIALAGSAVLNGVRLQRARREGGNTAQPLVRLALALVLALGILGIALF